MDIKQIVNAKAKGVIKATTSEVSQDLHLLQSISQASLSLPEVGLDRDNSPHDSDQSRYSSSSYVKNLNTVSNLTTGISFPSPIHLQNQLPMGQPLNHTNHFEKPVISQNTTINGEGRRPENAAPKAFLCSSCGKGFARRSDLARHERIHSGIRPHVCDHPNCGKQFIQRSALTVHMRVHTGEKPHMCERCGKPFSDSSSLARHRRIHSGKRPYKCPYADCQKTFTRRTTLTRHQTNHTGTVEEAAAATNAVLATRVGSNTRNCRVRPNADSNSNNPSPISTPSPGQRTISDSPNSELVPSNSNMSRHAIEYSYISNNTLPGHLRNKYNITNQTTVTSTAFPNDIPPRPTSHPNGYDPPTILEPPANNPSDRHVCNNYSNNQHANSISWQSPGSNMLSPSSNGYVYPDPDPYGSNNISQQIYYPNSNMRRPGSTEPESYEMKPRMNEMWTAAQ